jgi:hypothetical protein
MDINEPWSQIDLSFDSACCIVLRTMASDAPRLATSVLTFSVVSPASATKSHHSCMQTYKGNRPEGFVATEFQEWMRLKVVPTLEDFAEKHFKSGANSWFKARLYRDFSLYDAQGRPPKHRERDRRLFCTGSRNVMDIDAITQYVPSAPRVWDVIQCPVEITIALIKGRARQLINQLDKPSIYDIARCVFQAAQEAAGSPVVES